MEIITGIERRRRWRDDEKLRIVAEADAPGVVIAHVARRHGIARSQIFEWRRKVRSGELVSAPVIPEFLPVRVQEVVPAAGALDLPAVAPATGHLELSFPGGIRLRIEGKTDMATLRAVIAAMKR